MKISKKFEPLINGLAAGFVIAILALLTFESPFGVWIMFSFGSSALIVFVFYDSEFAQPRNIFFGHLLAICVGILVNSLLGVSFFSLGLSVALSVTLMIYFKKERFSFYLMVPYLLWSSYAFVLNFTIAILN